MHKISISCGEVTEKEMNNEIVKKLDRLDNKISKLLNYAEASDYQEEVIQYTLNEWLEKWLELYKVNRVKPSTLYQKQNIIKLYIRESIGLLPLTKIDGITLQRFLIRITAPRQREHVYDILRDSYKRAMSLQLIEYNPVQAVQLPQHTPKQSKALTVEEEESFLTACKGCIYGDIFVLMVHAGLRKGEALALTGADLDTVREVIHVTKSISFKNKVGTPKTRASVRDVPIVYADVMEIAKARYKTAGRLFRITDGTLDEHFYNVLKASGLYKQGYTMHSLRHTFATRCAEDDIPVKVLQKWLGHTTLNMTLGIYTHVNNDYEELVIQKYKRRKSENNAQCT